MKAFIVVTVIVLVGAIGALFSCTRSNTRETARQEEIVNDVKDLLSACTRLGNSGQIAIRGKALVWDTTKDSRSPAYEKLPPELQAKSSDTNITVFMVMDGRQVQTGTYNVSRQPGYKQYREIAIAYWPEKQAVGLFPLISQEPRSSRRVENRPEFGDSDQPIAKWIASLPKAN